MGQIRADQGRDSIGTGVDCLRYTVISMALGFHGAPVEAVSKSLDIRLQREWAVLAESGSPMRKRQERSAS